jgi:hypothetical protein
VGRSTLHLGTVVVTTTTSGYQRRRLSDGEFIERVDLELRPGHCPPGPPGTRSRFR